MHKQCRCITILYVPINEINNKLHNLLKSLLLGIPYINDMQLTVDANLLL